METTEARPIKLAADSLVVLAGPSGSGKSTWATLWFRPSQVVSTDTIRGVVGEHEHDLRASTDAFAVVDLIVERRLARGLFTVIDSLGMDVERNERWQRIAADHGRPTHLVVFDEDPKTCRSRNRNRPGEVPAKVLSAQLDKWAGVKDELARGFDHVHPAGPASIVHKTLLAPDREGDPGNAVGFGLLISTFDWPGGVEETGNRLGQIAAEAEAAGFESLWLMDHFMQIPQVGREWDHMLESYTTLGFLAARTSRIGLGAMVSCITHRNIGHLGKIVATLDVLSGGRARCGLGVGWFEREHRAYGYEFPTVGERYLLLEDALDFLPLLWGSGSPEFEGRTFSSPEAICYPRPVQDHVPILIGGSGEKRTLRLVAEHADACNLFGEPETIEQKIRILHQHCADVGRDPATIEVTQLSSILCASDESTLASRVDELRPARETPEAFSTRTMAGTVDDHIARFRRLGAVGVRTAIVSLADVGHENAVLGFAPVIEACGS